MSEEAILLTSRRFQSSGRVLFEALDDCASLSLCPSKSLRSLSRVQLPFSADQAEAVPKSEGCCLTAEVHTASQYRHNHVQRGLACPFSLDDWLEE
jgi:hypothetical protein